MTLRILHLEDSDLDAELVRGQLRQAGVECVLRRVSDREAYTAALDECWDLVLADFALPTFTGADALRLLRARDPETPFIFVSGALGDEYAIEAMRDGATDYVLKENLQRLGPAVRRAQDEAMLRAERRRAEADRAAAENQLRMLVAELNHRVGNILTVVQSIARHTVRSSTDLATFETSYMARLQALAQTHAILVRTEWQGAELRDILMAELGPHLADSSQRISLEGPAVVLRPNAAMNMALICHELATNAAKYGAFSNAVGRVSVDWRWRQGEDGLLLAVDWRERDGPPIAPPSRQGFGSRLIRKIAKGLGPVLDLAYAPEGLHCRLEIAAREVLETASAGEPAARAPTHRDPDGIAAAPEILTND